MRKNYFIIPFFALATGYFLTGNSNGPGNDYTGSPNSNGTCANCHLGASNLGATLNITVVEQGQSTPMTQYEAGKTYTVAVTLTGGTSTKKGFAATVLNATNTKVGTTTNPQGGAAIGSANSRDIAGHNMASTTGAWTFDWTAPPAPAGTIKIYAAGNATNSNTTNTGDQVLTKNISLTAAPTGTVSSVSPTGLHIFPNPAKNQLKMTRTYELVSIMDLQGKTLLKFSNTNQLDISALAAGIYFVLAGNGQGMQITKITKE